MAKRYMGEGDPVLDALYEELDAIKGNTEAESLRRIELKDQIRAIREQRGLFGLRGGIKSLFGGLFDDLGQGLLRQHISQPQLDQFADETVAGKDVFPTPAQDVLGFGRRRMYELMRAGVAPGFGGRGWQEGGQLEDPLFPVESELADESPWYPDEEVGYEAAAPMQGGFDIFGRSGG